METVDYLRALRRSYALILVCLLAGLAGAFLYVVSATKQYSATTRLLVSGVSGQTTTIDEISARALANARAVAYAQIASTQPAIQDAVAAAGPAGGPGQPGVVASATGTDPFLVVTVKGPHPEQDQAVANGYVKTLAATVTRLDQTGTAAVAQLSVLEPAALPGTPVSPKQKTALGLGAAVGLVLGLALAILRDLVDGALRDSDAVEKASGLSILGVVPKDAPKEKVPAETSPRGIRAEAYRQVRTSLLTGDSAAKLRTFIITSATSGEGKTSVATNLAKVFSRAGHRVVLVDADLRRPQVANYLSVPEGIGLTSVLSGTTPLSKALIVRDDGNFTILPSGPIPLNPSEALGGIGMEQLLDALRASYDYVIIDTPPVLPVTDALVLAPKVDGVVLVTLLGISTRDKLRRAKSAVDRVNANLLGIVPNGASTGLDSAYRYTYRRRGRGADAFALPTAPAGAVNVPTVAEHPQGQPTPAEPPIAPAPPVAPAPAANGVAAHAVATPPVPVPAPVPAPAVETPTPTPPPPAKPATAPAPVAVKPAPVVPTPAELLELPAPSSSNGLHATAPAKAGPPVARPGDVSVAKGRLQDALAELRKRRTGGS